MPEEKMSSTVHGIHEAIVKKNVKKLISFFTDDARLISSEGTFKGKTEIERYFTWMVEPYQEPTFRTVNLITQGNKAAHEYVIEAVSADGNKVHLPGVAMYDFKDGKAQEIRAYIDRLIIAKQVVKGRFPKRIVNTIIKEAEKGL